MTQKCIYYDKGYCKLKEKCQELHPSTDCVGECVNKITCPFRHRILCKNGKECIFIASSACAFLHPKEVTQDNNIIVLVEKRLDSVHGQITSLDNKIKLLEEHEDSVIQTSNVTNDLKTQIDRLTNESREQQKQLAESKLNVEMAIEKINTMDEEYSDRIEAIDLEWKASHTELQEKMHTLEKHIVFLKTNVQQTLLVQSSHVVQNKNSTQNPIIFVENQRKVYNDENFENFKCELCQAGFLKKWMVAKHTKDTHIEEKLDDQSHIDDRITNHVKESPHIKENVSHKYDKDTPKSVFSLNEIENKCVLCDKNFKSEANLKTHDKRCHMKKGSDNEYCCQYCSKTFSDKGSLVEHITNQHKKCCVCNNIFPSEKVLEAHAKAVHKKVQFKHTIEREPSFKNHKNKKYK